MKANARLYFPKPWANVDRTLQKRFCDVDAKLRAALCGGQPTYEDLSRFMFKAPSKTKVRSSIAKLIKGRPRNSFTMTHEVACFKKAHREGIYRHEESIYSAACRVRSLLFGKIEPLRTFDMTISYHAWMRIAPLALGDPVYSLLSAHATGPALFGAINLYLILLTSHPFTDGNGRTSRLMFSLHLAQAYGLFSHYVPLTEITRSTGGIYEEYIGSACQHGDYRQLIWHLLSLLESYASFLQSEMRSAPKRAPENDLAKVLRMAAARRSAGVFGINQSPPFLLSIPDMLDNELSTQVDKEFLATLLKISKTLGQYGLIDFALTGLADISPVVFPRTGAVAFFMKADRKDDLLLRFRELRASYSHIIKMQVAISSGDPVVDAKLLVALVSHYTCRDPEASSCPVFLHDFPIFHEIEHACRPSDGDSSPQSPQREGGDEIISTAAGCGHP